MRAWQWPVIVFTLLALLLVVAVFWPLPPLDTRPPRELAGPESRFLTVGATEVHYQRSGEGEPAWVLLHGFGASAFSWREVMAPGALPGTRYAFDRPAFGLTSRDFPGSYGEDEVLALTMALLDEWGLEEAIVVGHSAGGRLAALLARDYPERVSRMVLISPALQGRGSPPRWVQRILKSSWLEPLARRLIRRALAHPHRALQTAWHDSERLTQEVVEGYALPLKAQDWDRALWHFALAQMKGTQAPVSLGDLTQDILVIVGDADDIIDSQKTLEEIGDAGNVEVHLISDCGHLPHEEKPGPVLSLLRLFLGEMK